PTLFRSGPSPSSATRLSSAFRSAPAQNVPPSPHSTATAASGSSSNARKASASSPAVLRSTALRACGLLITTVVTGPRRSTRTVIVAPSRNVPSVRPARAARKSTSEDRGRAGDRGSVFSACLVQNPRGPQVARHAGSRVVECAPPSPTDCRVYEETCAPAGWGNIIPGGRGEEVFLPFEEDGMCLRHPPRGLPAGLRHHHHRPVPPPPDHGVTSGSTGLSRRKNSFASAGESRPG